MDFIIISSAYLGIAVVMYLFIEAILEPIKAIKGDIKISSSLRKMKIKEKEEEETKKKIMEEHYLFAKKVLKDTDSNCNISRNQILGIMEKLTEEHLKGRKPSNLEYLEVVEEIYRIISKAKKHNFYADTIITETLSLDEQRYIDIITSHISSGVKENILDIYNLLYDLIKFNSYDKLAYVEIIFLETVINIVRLNLKNKDISFYY